MNIFSLKLVLIQSRTSCLKFEFVYFGDKEESTCKIDELVMNTVRPVIGGGGGRARADAVRGPGDRGALARDAPGARDLRGPVQRVDFQAGRQEEEEEEAEEEEENRRDRLQK